MVFAQKLHSQKELERSRIKFYKRFAKLRKSGTLVITRIYEEEAKNETQSLC